MHECVQAYACAVGPASPHLASKEGPEDPVGSAAGQASGPADKSLPGAHLVLFVLLVSSLAPVALKAPGKCLPVKRSAWPPTGLFPRVPTITCSFKTPLSPANQVASVVQSQETLWKRPSSLQLRPRQAG